ncbi:hypothetical protein [Hymenobacter terricola]|uniref:hypothetical protein n=1 Tax=Hymenobacter terricola TaxID=2819236 RepID=UPI001B301CEB|nr:hypothetical protein [Hymenobacter terricola]
MRYIFCLLLPLLLGSTVLFAQAPAAATPSSPGPTATEAGAVLLFNDWYLPAYQPGTPAADTTGALLSLFRKRRYAGILFTVPFIVGISLALPIASKDAAGQRTVAAEAISPPIGSAILVGTVVGFIMHATKFSKANLVAIDKAYAAGHSIPARYRSQLNASHFAEAAYLREAIAQQKAREPVATPGK